MANHFEIFNVDTGETVEGGFFSRERAEDYAWQNYPREAEKDVYGVRAERTDN